jgi:AraC-like DNA-binding protein
VTDYSGVRFAFVRGSCQEVAHTASRRTGPRRWRRAVEWLIAAGHHPRATATTLRVAEDLAARMDYDTGHVRYCLDEMAARLGLSRASVKRHVGYLREMGALAWVQHGTRTNIRRLMGLKGYAATATIYAAVIPAAYDHAMGHRIIGTGYTARIVIDEWGQAPEPVDTCGNSPVDNSAPEALEPPSLTWLRKESKVEVEGGCNYTEQARPPKARIPHQSSLINGRRRTAADVQKASNEIRMVRALVNWTQSVPLRRLEFVLRPWTDRGWDALRIADELHGMCAGVRWKPKNPVAFIRARIAADTAHQEALAQAVAWEDSTAYREMATMRALLGAPAAEPQPERERTDEDRLRARMDWNIWPEVIAHFEEDELDALDLYGKRLVDFAIDQHARTRVSDHAYL